MSDSILRSEWARTANILCMMANINRDENKKKTPYTAYDFMPFKDRRLKDVQPRKLSIKEFCEMFKGAALH
jgi:hypothetical protein